MLPRNSETETETDLETETETETEPARNRNRNRNRNPLLLTYLRQPVKGLLCSHNCVVISVPLWVVAPCPQRQGRARRLQEPASWLAPAPVPARPLQMPRGRVRPTATRAAVAVRAHGIVLARRGRLLARAAERAHLRRGRGAARRTRRRRRRQLPQLARARLLQGRRGRQGRSAPSSAPPWAGAGARPQQPPLARPRSRTAWWGPVRPSTRLPTG